MPFWIRSLSVNSDYLSVSALNRLLKAKFEADDDLHNLFVEGEISSWKTYPNATYFDLKDATSVLSCILWGTSSLYLPFEPKIGDEVLVRGDLSVYPPRGRYSLMAPKRPIKKERPSSWSSKIKTLKATINLSLLKRQSPMENRFMRRLWLFMKPISWVRRFASLA